MSIDYDQLRERLEESTPGPWERNPESPRVLCNLERKFAVHVELTRNGEEPQPEDVTNTELIALAPDMARELLRLRRELIDLRDLMQTHAQYLAQDGLRTAAEYAYDHALRLTRILQGDTE